MATIKYQSPGAPDAVLDSVVLGTDYATQQELRRETVDVRDSMAPLLHLLQEIRSQNYASVRALSEINGSGFQIVPETLPFLAF